MREWTRRLFALALFSGLSACGGSDEITMNLPQNTVQEAQTDSHITILAKAVGAVDVQESLFGTGPFAVVAPTNAASAALLIELGDTSQLLANAASLSRVSTHGVVSSRLLKGEVPTGLAVTTVQGGSLAVSSTLAITDARGRTSNISAADVLASNGVIHVIDQVLRPAP